MLFEKILLANWKLTKKMDDKRLSAQSMPKGIEVIKDIPYADGGKANLLDVYYPQGTSKPLPVIIVVHGGGWMYGDKELNQIYAMNLALRGFSIVNINYHLAQEKRFPQQIKDIYDVFNWIFANGKDYFLDIENVFITGDSAGAHLSAVSLALLDNAELRKQLNVDTKLKIKAGGVICGAFELDAFKGIKKLVAAWYGKVVLGQKVKKSEYAKTMSAIKSINKKLPPLYLMTSSQDFLKDQTLHFVEFLKANNFEHKFRYGDEPKDKKLTHVFNVCYPLKKEAVVTNDEMCRFFMQYIT